MKQGNPRLDLNYVVAIAQRWVSYQQYFQRLFINISPNPAGKIRNVGVSNVDYMDQPLVNKTFPIWGKYQWN